MTNLFYVHIKKRNFESNNNVKEINNNVRNMTYNTCMFRMAEIAFEKLILYENNYK